MTLSHHTCSYGFMLFSTTVLGCRKEARSTSKFWMLRGESFSQFPQILLVNLLEINFMGFLRKFIP